MTGENGLVLDWEGAFQAGADVAGGKGWNLGRLARYGFDIPVGWVVVAAAYEEFIELNGLRETVRAVADRVSETSLGEEEARKELAGLRARIAAGVLPQGLGEALEARLTAAGLLDRPVAVRSSATGEDSATASFAGIHDSFLNVRGSVGILDAIKGCYASIWSERAVAYRRRLGISDYEVAPAVVVMAMVEAHASGVAFSCDPCTGREDRVVVAANFGLGESVVGGRVEPDEYTVAWGRITPELTVEVVRVGRKQCRTVAVPEGGTACRTDETANGRQVLTQVEILHLAALVRQALLVLGNGETHQDIEWVHDGERFVLVQARPVTALRRHTYPPLREQPDFWSNANFRDALPMVQTPLNWSFSRPLLEMIFRSQYKAAGYTIDPAVCRARLFNGRAYFNLSVLQWECYDAFGFPPAHYNSFIGGHQPEIALPADEPALRRLRRLAANLRMLRAVSRARKSAASTFHDFTRRVDEVRGRDFARLSDEEMLGVVREFYDLFNTSEPLMVMLGTGGAVFATLVPLLERFFPGRGRALTTALLAGREGVTSADHGIRLVELAESAEQDPAARAFFTAEPFAPAEWVGLPVDSPFRRAFQVFLEEYGHRCVYELDFRNPRWYEDPGYLLLTIRGMSGATSLEAVRSRQRETAERAWREVGERVPRLLRPLIRRIAAGGGKDAGNREMAKSLLVRLGDVVRRVALEIGRRLAERGVLTEEDDVFFCFWQELTDLLTKEWDGAGVAARVMDRRERHAEWERLPAPDLVRDDQPHCADQPAVEAGAAMTGLGVSSGRARGRARLIRHPDEGIRLRAGEILVAPSTDPAWTPLFLKAVALVAETGGFISHGAIVAREYGIPAVLNVAGALSRLNDGEEIVVDGDAGRVWFAE